MSSPSVVIFGPSGFIGKEIVPAFLEALQKQEISSLTLATRNGSSPQYDAVRSQGARVSPAVFDDREVLIDLLRDADVVISCTGTMGDYNANRKALVEACKCGLFSPHVDAIFCQALDLIYAYGPPPGLKLKSWNRLRSRCQGVCTLGMGHRPAWYQISSSDVYQQARTPFLCRATGSQGRSRTHWPDYGNVILQVVW